MAGGHRCLPEATLPESLCGPRGEEGGGQGGFTEERMFESGICREDRHPRSKGNGRSRGLGPAGCRLVVAEGGG